jgi:hypothetical protein
MQCLPGLTRSLQSGLVGVLLLGLAGCAEMVGGRQGTSLDAEGKPSEAAAKAAKLKVSAGEINRMSSPYFGEIELTFENPTGQWVRVKTVQVDFGDEKKNKAAAIPWGMQLESWIEATRQRNALRNADEAATLEIIAGLTALAVVAGGARGGGAEVVAGMLPLGAAAAMTRRQGTAETEDVTTAPLFGAGHLLAGPFEVPPGLLVKRWLVVNTPDDRSLGCISTLTLTYALTDDSVHRVALAFRSTDTNEPSQWQLQACRPIGTQAFP